MNQQSIKNGTKVEFLVEAEAEGIVESYDSWTGQYKIRLVMGSCTATKTLFHLPEYLLERKKQEDANPDTDNNPV